MSPSLADLSFGWIFMIFCFREPRGGGRIEPQRRSSIARVPRYHVVVRPVYGCPFRQVVFPLILLTARALFLKPGADQFYDPEFIGQFNDGHGDQRKNQQPKSEFDEDHNTLALFLQVI